MKYAFAIAALCLLKLYQLGSAPAPISAPAASWGAALAYQLGNRAPSPEIVRFIDSWIAAENTAAAFNPLATTQPMPGATDYNNVGVKNYASADDGLAATVATLQQNYPGYAEIAAGIQTNDVQRAFNGLSKSPWGTNAADVAAIYNGGSTPAPAAAVPAGSSASSTPIANGGDDCGYNVAAALAANGGALQQVTIAPGQTFSFNATMGDPARIEYRLCAGVPGGNWCNLAARYSQVARALGLSPQFLHHGVDLGAGIENDVLIWNIGGAAGFENGGQDLLITNTAARPLHFQAQADTGAVVIIGWFA